MNGSGASGDDMDESQSLAQEQEGGQGRIFVRPIPFWKRTMDFIGAGFALLIFSPVILAVALAIKFTSPGPVFFKQERAGQGGRPFKMYKFRSMIPGASKMQDELRKFNERDGPAFKMTNDPRVTPVGRFIRKWSLDELPQFINVFKGDMSLVGPRPLPVNEDGGMKMWHDIRRDVKPGITCLWQITKRDESDFDEWVRLDIKYVRKLSFLLDLKILLMTPAAVLSKRGAK